MVYSDDESFCKHRTRTVSLDSGKHSISAESFLLCGPNCCTEFQCWPKLNLALALHLLLLYIEGIGKMTFQLNGTVMHTRSHLMEMAILLYRKCV